MAHISNYSARHGEVAEWLKAAVLKIATPCKRRRRFKSYSLRQNAVGSGPQWITHRIQPQSIRGSSPTVRRAWAAWRGE